MVHYPWYTIHGTLSMVHYPWYTDLCSQRERDTVLSDFYQRRVEPNLTNKLAVNTPAPPVSVLFTTLPSHLNRYSPGAAMG